MSNKINKLKKVIHNYVNLDNEIKLIEKKVKNKKKQKTLLEKYLIDTFKTNNLHNKEILVTNDQSLRFIENDKKEALSQKYIKKTLNEFFINNYSHNLRKERCEEKAHELFDYLLNNRVDKKSYNLKIIKNN